MFVRVEMSSTSPRFYLTLYSDSISVVTRTSIFFSSGKKPKNVPNSVYNIIVLEVSEPSTSQWCSVRSVG